MLTATHTTEVVNGVLGWANQLDIIKEHGYARKREDIATIRMPLSSKQ